MTAAYAIRAHNVATASENKIHDDAVARAYGFEGGLVPGVTVYAYLTHSVVAELGRAWLERGRMTARFVSPCYDGDALTIEANGPGDADGPGLDLTASRPGDEVVATATASVPARPPRPPVVDAYPAAALPAERVPATEAALAALGPLRSWEATFHAEHTAAFLDEIDEDLALYRDGGPAHPGYLLLAANWIFGANVRLGPWMHVGSDVTNYGVVEDGDRVSTRGRVARLFERKGHRFVDLDLLMVANDTRPVLHALHTAIYEIAKR
jgi:acyl dehydratase